MPVLLGLALGALLLQAAPAGAAFRPKPPGTPPPTVRGNTEIVMTGTGPGQGVAGFIADPSSTFDPVTDGYPVSNPPSPEFHPKDEGFAGVIHGHEPPSGPTLNLYCIDIFTLTQPGIGYGLGTWDDANVPNVGYVARVLEEYYPHTDEPATLTDLNQKAAAVQAAVWFFSDRYVLNTSMGALRDTVVGIVDHVISEGALVARSDRSP